MLIVSALSRGFKKFFCAIRFPMGEPLVHYLQSAFPFNILIIAQDLLFVKGFFALFLFFIAERLRCAFPIGATVGHHLSPAAGQLSRIGIDLRLSPLDDNSIAHLPRDCNSQ